jgi:nicotinamide mononucleotide (NMN) deamidase PncC
MKLRDPVLVGMSAVHSISISGRRGPVMPEKPKGAVCLVIMLSNSEIKEIKTDALTTA